MKQATTWKTNVITPVISIVRFMSMVMISDNELNILGNVFVGNWYSRDWYCTAQVQRGWNNDKGKPFWHQPNML